ncbi:TetR/AcrR family transcriptional regulator [Kocuria oceani]
MPRVSQQYKDERRREIVAAASRCFLEHGFGGASMHRIIAATGLSAGALYNHFPSKHELVVASARAALDRVLTADEDPAPAGDEGTARAAAGIVASYVQWHLERAVRSLHLVERS